MALSLGSGSFTGRWLFHWAVAFSLGGLSFILGGSFTERWPFHWAVALLLGGGSFHWTVAFSLGGLFTGLFYWAAFSRIGNTLRKDVAHSFWGKPLGAGGETGKGSVKQAEGGSDECRRFESGIYSMPARPNSQQLDPSRIKSPASKTNDWRSEKATGQQ